MVKQLHPVNIEFAYVQLFYGWNLSHNILSSFVCSRLAPHEQMNIKVTMRSVNPVNIGGTYNNNNLKDRKKWKNIMICPKVAGT
jgi:hypothetical protein